MYNPDYFEAKTQSIRDQLEGFVRSGAKIFTTSSFQAQSLPLLHIISSIPGCKTVFMTDTGYLFPETHSFALSVCKQFDLRLEVIRSSVPKFAQTDIHGKLLYTSDPDLCCEINKVTPLQPVLIEYDVWVNGIRRDQSSDRASLSEFEDSRSGCIRYHPLLGWSAQDIFYYRKIFSLPNHPLESRGYQSVGCQPCTVTLQGRGNERNARWFGMNKTECGLNTDLIVKSSNDK